MTEDELELLRIGARNAEKLHEQMGGTPYKAPEPPEWTPRTRRCERCRNLFEQKRLYTNGEIEILHKLFYIKANIGTYEFVFCESCYEIITETPMRLNNESSLDIGGANCQPPNYLLQRAYGQRK